MALGGSGHGRRDRPSGVHRLTRSLAICEGAFDSGGGREQVLLTQGTAGRVGRKRVYSVIGDGKRNDWHCSTIPPREMGSDMLDRFEVVPERRRRGEVVDQLRVEGPGVSSEKSSTKWAGE